jgi:outer membrane protein OmpA-like peptidoglycan-associated protein
MAGSTGAQGSTTTGVVGAVGRAGDAGPQGPVGSTGTQGGTQAGVAGAVGLPGEPGPQGPVGATGATGPAGVVSLWTLYRDFRFEYNRSDLQASEAKKVSEIARYMKANPSLKIGLDGSMDPRGLDPRNQGLSDRRVSAIRDALIKAGVPASKIQLGAFGDKQLARDRRVAVLLCTAN